MKAKITESEDQEDLVDAVLRFRYRDEEYLAEADGNGPIDAVKRAVVSQIKDIDVTIQNYWEHALSEGSHAKAVAYIEMKDNRSGKLTYGVGLSSNITRATIRAVFSALNRLFG